MLWRKPLFLKPAPTYLHLPLGTSAIKFPEEENFCSRLGLAPHNDISGGKVLHSYTPQTNHRAGRGLRPAAATIVRANCAFGAFYRRMKSRLGPAQANVAAAHKMARVIDHILKFKIEYRTMTAGEYEHRLRERGIKYLERQATRLGYAISPKTAPVLAVS